MIIKNDRLKVEKFTISDAFFGVKLIVIPKFDILLMEKTNIFAVSCLYKKNISSYEKSGFGRYIVRLRKITK